MLSPRNKEITKKICLAAFLALILIVILWGLYESSAKTSTKKLQSISEEAITPSLSTLKFEVDPAPWIANTKRMGITLENINHINTDSLTTALRDLKPYYLRGDVSIDTILPLSLATGSTPWIILSSEVTQQELKNFQSILHKEASRSHFAEIILEASSENDFSFDKVASDAGNHIKIRRASSSLFPDNYEGNTIAPNFFYALNPKNKNNPTFQSLFGNSREISKLWNFSEQKAHPAGILFKKINEVVGGSLHKIQSDEESITSVAFRTTGGWSAALINNGNKSFTIALTFPEDHKKIPNRVEAIDLDPSGEYTSTTENNIIADRRTITLKLPSHCICIVSSKD